MLFAVTTWPVVPRGLREKELIDAEISGLTGDYARNYAHLLSVFCSRANVPPIPHKDIHPEAFVDPDKANGLF